MKIIVGNWKMNGNKDKKKTMIQALSETQTKNNIILCLPFTLLGDKNKDIHFGAQNISEHENGAYTGDISGQMIADTGAKYVIVGHSERRFYHNETNELVLAKANAAIKSKLIPIICVGETLAEKEAGTTITVIKEMLDTCLPATGKFIVAYEPRWAIGTGLTPTIKETETIHNMIYEYLESHNHKTTPILYGGSVSPKNAAEFASVPHVDGLLIGGASLEIETFLPIIESVK